MLAVDVQAELPVSAARSGDPAAWDVLFQRYQLPLYAYLAELVRDPQDALDLVQDTFLSAVRHLAGLRTDARFGSWLFAIAHQKWVGHCRRRGRRIAPAAAAAVDPGAVLEAVADDAPEPGDWLIQQEQEERFMTWLNELPPSQRSVVLLHALEEFTLEEIAAIAQVPLGTVKSRLHYARKTLRARLEEDRA